MDERTGLPVVTMIGAGQLARMTHQAAVALGQSLRVLAAGPDEPAALVAPDVVLGEHTDLDALRKAGAGAEAITFDHEHVPGEHLRALVDEGHTVHPGPDALLHAQDKLVMRTRLAELGEPVPPFAAGVRPRGRPDLRRRARLAGGAQGRARRLRRARRVGPRRRRAGAEHRRRAAGRRHPAHGRAAGGRCAASSPSCWRARRSGRRPCGRWSRPSRSRASAPRCSPPRPGLDPERAEEAEELALRIAAAVGVVGLLAVELFETEDGLLVNELAMRPHNSGHWTIEGSVTSQFEQHLRAVLDYPLGATTTTAPVTVMANVLGGDPTPAMRIDERLHHTYARFPDARVHLYGKAERPGRKIGHVTVRGDDLDEVRTRARLAADHLSTGVWSDGWDPHA